MKLATLSRLLIIAMLVNMPLLTACDDDEDGTTSDYGGSTKSSADSGSTMSSADSGSTRNSADSDSTMNSVDIGPTDGGSTTDFSTASVPPESAAGIWGRYPKVIAEYIKIPGYDEPNTPEEFDHAYFMRYRYNTGESTPPPVKAILLAQPGGACGQGLWVELASQTVNLAKGNVEVWVIDRRENGLEDTEGLRRAIDAKDESLATDYYFADSPEFTLITQEDTKFMAHWGLEVIIRDAEAVLNLVPKEYQSTNVFLAGHSQGGRFIFDFAGYEFPDGKAGYEKVAGLVFVDGGPRIGVEEASDFSEWEETVQRLVDGVDPVFGVETPVGITTGPLIAIPNNIDSVAGFFKPDGESKSVLVSMLPAIGGEPATLFKQSMRITNEAAVNWFFDDDPIPGSMTQFDYFYTGGARTGRLDFPALTEPGVPSTDLVDPNKVYGWLSGGGGEPAGDTDDGPLSGYPKNEEDGWQLYPPNPNPTRSDTMSLVGIWAGEATNIKEPTSYAFPESGEVKIYEGSPNNALWYQNARYDVDVAQAMDMDNSEMNITRKADIDIPTIAYTRRPHREGVEQYLDETKVSDCTLIDSTGVHYWGDAADITTVSDADLINTRLYNHVDFVTADSALAGEVPPGTVGANVISNTVVGWMLDRVDGTVPVPTPEELGVE